MLNRRVFASSVGLAAGAAALRLSAAPAPRKLKAGHTGITWDNNVPQALEDCGKLGFHGFETFGQVMEAWDANGGMERVLDPNHVPLVSAYCTFNMVDPSKRQDELAKMSRWGQLLKKHNGKVVVMGPNPVNRQNYRVCRPQSRHRGEPERGCQSNHGPRAYCGSPSAHGNLRHDTRRDLWRSRGG